MLNKVMIIGRLGRDPDLKYSQNGAPVCTLNIATDESYTDAQGQRVERTEWHRVAVFQRNAENCKNFLRKGSLVYVEGSLQTRKWQDQNTGQDRYLTEVRAQRVQFLDRRDAQEGGGYRPNSYADKGGPAFPPEYQQMEQKNRGYRSTPQQNNPPDDDSPAFPHEAPQMDQGDRGYHSAPQQNNPSDDDGPVFPSEASQMDEVPF